MDSIIKLESDIDDCSGEILGYVLERLLAAGALDAHYQPVFMKKNRPGYELQVLCREQDRAELEAIIFAETTTIGIRRLKMERSALPRRKAFVQTVYGDVEVKLCRFGGSERVYAEYESAARLARGQGVPLHKIYEAVISAQVK